MDPRDLDNYYTIKDEKNNVWKKFKYARGYLISDSECTVKLEWKKMSIRGGQYYITYDPLNEVVYYENQNNWVLILGTAMDTIDWHMNLSKIAKKCLQKATVKLEDFYNYIDFLNGRHIIFLSVGGKTILLQDATGMRSVYFHRNHCFIASHYNLINDFVKCERNTFMMEFIAMQDLDDNPWMLPGNTTPYSDVMSLLPNHAIDFDSKKVYRFWPRMNHGEVSFDEAMSSIAAYLYKQMDLLVKERKIMVQLTRGNDSRISLAATKNVKDNILYYSYYSEDPNSKVDHEYAKKIAKELDLNFKDIDVEDLGMSLEEYGKLTAVAVYNSYHWHLFRAIGNFNKFLPEDRITVRSNLIEIIRSSDEYFGNFPVEGITYMDMVKATYPSKINDNNVRKMWKRFYEENQWDSLYNYFPCDLFYWEYRMGTWMSHGVILKDDWNFDTYMLFNCRKLLEIGLSAPFFYTKGGYTPRAIVKRLWPQLFFEIPNTELNLLKDFYNEEYKNSQSLCSFDVKSYGPSVEVKKYVKLGRKEGVIGFSSQTVRRGDTIQIGKDFTILREGNYHLQLNIQVPAKRYKHEPYCAKCRIEFGDMSALIFDLNRCWGMENQIDIFVPCKKGNVSLIIKIISEKDIQMKLGIPGIIVINSIYFNATYRDIKSINGFDVYSTIALN